MPLVPHRPAAEIDEHAALIVALDAGDLSGDELGRAAALPDTCPGCAALRDDLAAIRGAMTALPVPPRRRDFRLTEEDATRLRPSGWRRIVGWLAAPRSSVRPLATGLATLGVVGLLLTAGIPSFGAGGVAILSAVGDSVDTTERNGVQEYAAPSNAPITLPSGVPAPGDEPGRAAATANPADVQTLRPTEQPVAGAQGEGTTDGSGDAGTLAGEPDELKVPADDAGVPLPAVLSIVLLAVGLGLFAARALARRRLA